jgi:tetratricopeptide (TPR) repeat protein
MSEVELDVLSLEAAIDFLLLRTESTADQRKAAESLARELGCLPLALEQAAAFIRRRRSTLGSYVSRFRDARKVLLQEGSEGGTRYLTSVGTTWQISIDQISSLARCILRVSSFMASDEIPIAMLSSGRNELAAAMELPSARLRRGARKVTRKARRVGISELDVERAVGELNDYSLVSLRDDAFSIHRLVQVVQLDFLDGPLRKAWAEIAMRLVIRSAPEHPGDVQTWPFWNRLHPHVASILEHAQTAGLAEFTSELMSELGEYCYGRALYHEAEPLFRKALDIDEQCLGSNHPALARRFSNLAGLLHVTGRLAEAETLYRRALAIDEQLGNADDPNLVGDLSNLAGVLGATNRLAEAETLIRRVLAIDEAHFGRDHPEVAIDLNNLAGLLRVTERLREAEPLYRRALAIDEQHFDPNHPVIARDLNNLAMSLLSVKKISEAEPMVRRALAIDERNLGPEHPNTATGLNDLGMILSATGRFAEAEPLYQRALAIDRQSYGEFHPKVARDLSNLAALLLATKRFAEAEPFYRQALEINERVLGPDHPAVGFDLNNLAMLLRSMDRLAEAEPIYRRALGVLERAFGPNHPKVGTALENLEVVLRGLGHVKRADVIGGRAERIRKMFHASQPGKKRKGSASERRASRPKANPKMRSPRRLRQC